MNKHNSSLFVVFHSRLHEEQYSGIESTFLYAKVGDKPVEVTSPKIKERIVYHKEMPVSINKGKHWAESEFLISMYESMKAHPQYNNDKEWIGFMQYDHTTEDLVPFLENNLSKLNDKTIISFVPIDMSYEIDMNHIAMDVNNPQKLQGDPLCYFLMIADYNKFYGTNHSYMSFRSRNKTIALCSSFIITTKNFMEMMKFCTWAAEKNNLDQFDPARIHRMAGGLMERYYGCWLALSNINLIEFPLKGLPRL